ncbi:MAG: hypothetical protein LUF91_01615 [Oscillospiraceae bacterium]|nr:hypothetical protein [Oscillospiraceae bacterium]
MKSYLVTILSNSYFLLFVTAAFGAALGKIHIKGFTLGSTGGIFTGIVIGWGITELMDSLAEDPEVGTTASSLVSGGLVPSGFMMFFLLLFICAVGLSVGKKLKTVMNRNFFKLIAIGIFIPVVSMCMTLGVLKIAPTFIGDDYNIYQISGLYSGAMTNTAALGTSMEVIGNIDAETRYEELSDADKTRALEMIGAEDTTLTDSLTGEQAGTFLGKAKANVSTGYAISFPVGTVVIILAMTLISIPVNKRRPADWREQTPEVTEVVVDVRKRKKPGAGGFFFNAVAFGITIGCGILLGNIEVPLGNGVTFSLSAVGGVLISALVFGNISRIGPINMQQDPKILGFVREFSLLFFMSVIGLSYGYDVIHAFASTGIFIAIMALIIESIAILLAILIGRPLMKMDWGLLCGAISGGCTSSVGLGAALNTMGGEEPTVGYGISQPFAILANVILISLFHSYIFI